MRHDRQKGDGEEGDIKGQTKALMKERRGPQEERGSHVEKMNRGCILKDGQGM